MEPSEVRRTILHDHHALREQLHDLALKVEDLRAGGDPAPVRDQLLTLLEDLVAHMAREDEILAPALLQTDAWGPWRVEKMKAHHEADRARVASLQRSLREDKLDAKALVRAAVRLTADLQAEMAEEDKLLLHPEVLRDDLVTSGFGG